MPQVVSDEIVAMGKRCGIIFPPSLPIYKSPPNYGHLKEWADSQVTPRLREIAHKMVNNLRYISFKEFLNALQQTIETFNEVIGDAPFVIVATGNENKATKGSSDRWIPAVAFQYSGLKSPANIVTIAQLPQFLHNNPNIKNVLFLDDATYSGTQMQGNIAFLISALNTHSKASSMCLHIAIPYYSGKAKERIFAAVEDENIALNFIAHQEMPTMSEILDVDDIEYLKKIKCKEIQYDQTLTYFDHRFADYFSVYQNIYTGKMIEFDFELLLNTLGYTQDERVAKNDPKLKLITEKEFAKLLTNLDHEYLGYNIPQVIKAYSLSDMDYSQLENAIKFSRVGDRSEYEVVNPNMRDIVDTTKPYDEKLIAGCPYVESAISLEDQQKFDESMVSNLESKPRRKMR